MKKFFGFIFGLIFTVIAIVGAVGVGGYTYIYYT